MLKRLISAISLTIPVEMWDLVSLGMLGAIGFLIGYALKKLVKLLLFFAGLFLLALVGLEYLGAIKINYDKLDEALISALGSIQGLLPQIMPLLSGLFYSLSFGAGFLLGLMKG
jgi:uncharacterized membrane protein (Fun14 family)